MVVLVDNGIHSIHLLTLPYIQFIQFNSPVVVAVTAVSFFLVLWKHPHTKTTQKPLRYGWLKWRLPCLFLSFFFFISRSLSLSLPFFDPHELSLCVVVVVEYKGYSSLLLLCVPFVRMSSPFEINTTITHPYIHEAVKQANEWMNEWKNE